MSARLPAPAQAGPALRDIHLPPAPSWWPPAPGWWLLAALLLALAAIGLLAWRRRRRARIVLRRVLAEVDALAARHAADADDGAFAAGLHQLLRRAARRLDARAVSADGEAWRALLARVPVDAGTMAQLERLEQALYRPLPLDRDAALAAARRWLARALRQRVPRKAEPVAHA